MSFTEDYATQADSRRISASEFEVIRPVRHGKTDPRKGELVIGRRTHTGRLYAIKVVRKGSLGADHEAYTPARTEQAALRLVTERAIPCTMQLYWSFQDEKALYLIMVSQPATCSCVIQFIIPHRTTWHRICERSWSAMEFWLYQMRRYSLRSWYVFHFVH